MKYEAQKPDLRLIREVRKTEQERVETVGENIPEYFLVKDLINENHKHKSQHQITPSKNEASSKTSQLTLTPVFEASQQITNSHETSLKFEEPQKTSNEASNKFEDSHTSSQISKISEEKNQPSQLKNEEPQMSSSKFEGLPEEFAKDYLDRNDKLPTIKLIKEKTGATDWTARQARSNLKKQQEKAS
jgi:hypothetical protein